MDGSGMDNPGKADTSTMVRSDETVVAQTLLTGLGASKSKAARPANSPSKNVLQLSLLPAVPHEPIGKQIFRALRHAIFTGTLVPGTPLSEKEVSDLFHVSRQPVREAFIKLVEVGVLQVLPQRGTMVKKISPREVRQGRFIREAIETAVTRKSADVITDAQLQTLASNLREQKAAAKLNDTAEFLALDEQFHSLIAQSIDCVTAWNTVQDIKAQMDRVRYLSLQEVSPLDLLIKQHARVLAALKAHDADAAEDAMRAHLREILVSLAPVVARHPDWFESDEADVLQMF
jgi:DNA-binding GntR family transcriptional regulator